MSQHYDIEKITQQIRDNINSVNLPPGAKNEAVIQMRNSEIDVSLAVFGFKEQNLGSDPTDVIKAFASMSANFLVNYVGDSPTPVKETAFNFFLNVLESFLARHLEGGDSDYKASAKTMIMPEEGGHA